MPTTKQDTYITGGICSVLGLYEIASNLTNFNDVLVGFFLIGLGLVFMASTDKAFRKQFFDFIFSIFKGLWDLLSGNKF